METRKLEGRHRLHSSSRPFVSKGYREHPPLNPTNPIPRDGRPPGLFLLFFYQLDLMPPRKTQKEEQGRQRPYGVRVRSQSQGLLSSIVPPTICPSFPPLQRLKRETKKRTIEPNESPEKRKSKRREKQKSNTEADHLHEPKPVLYGARSSFAQASSLPFHEGTVASWARGRGNTRFGAGEKPLCRSSTIPHLLSPSRARET
ncbi:hypothetical protein FA10DRAFT_155473 [Acaromyces ingoldii]|uniref:Uncharacterized protein n=1 Tax=Acaromyces ingoldii TaxID=215250 RepID=A0A316YGA2_9BASI|nr:hypothetical protein FA10DRAFT_155473 [Acaromyces ingoldii]PWN88136.1 hypothetical protein FA10DRAFT_155473 [Acaromyces ingoldii]